MLKLKKIKTVKYVKKTGFKFIKDENGRWYPLLSDKYKKTFVDNFFTTKGNEVLNILSKKDVISRKRYKVNIKMGSISIKMKKPISKRFRLHSSNKFQYTNSNLPVLANTNLELEDSKDNFLLQPSWLNLIKICKPKNVENKVTYIKIKRIINDLDYLKSIAQRGSLNTRTIENLYNINFDNFVRSITYYYDFKDLKCFSGLNKTGKLEIISNKIYLKLME